MSEKNVNEKNGNEKNGNEKSKTEKKRKSKIRNEKRFYLITAIGCAAALVAIIVIAALVNNTGNVQSMRDPAQSSEMVDSNHSNSENSSDDGENSENNSEDDGGTNKPVGGESEGMAMPVATVAVGNDYGFYHNKTLNNYYEHTGVDFTAEVGTEVFAVEGGVIESIYKEDLLLGTEIVVAHENGVKSSYRFVTEKEGLKVGDRVEKGDVIATVAEPTGNEYKDGAHLHFEITVDGKNVDPATYLTLEEK